MKGHIKSRLIVSLLTVAAVPLVGVGLYSIQSNTAALRQLALAAARERAQLKAKEAEEMLRDIRSDLFFLARSPTLFSLLDELDRDEVQARFWRRKLGQQLLAFTHNKPVYASLRYIGENGFEVVRAEYDGLRSWLVPDQKLELRATRNYFRAALALSEGEVYVSAADRSDGEAREPVVRYALRVIDRHDQRRGVLAADVFARSVVEALNEGRDNRTWLLDHKGNSLLPPLATSMVEHPVESIMTRLTQRPEVVLVEEGEETTVSWAAVWPAMPGSAPMWVLVDIVPKAEVFASVNRFRLVFAGLVIAVVAASLGLSLLLARRVAGPLGALRDGARRISRGDLAHRLTVDTGDEIQEVAEEFNRMGQALQETYRQLEARDIAKTDQLEKVTQQLVESEKLAAVGQLAAGVAHEINNPVGVVSMFVQQLLERGHLNTDQAAKLRVIVRHVDRIGRITKGLLDFARARQHRRDRFDVVGSVHASLEAMGPRLSAAAITVEMCASEGVEIKGDEQHLQQVFENLMLNAVQAMVHRGKLKIAVERREAVVLVKLADTGPGISEEDIQHVFEPFYTTKEVGEGTGLGLAISYGIVKAHGGSLSVENLQGGGALFTVVLPLANAEIGKEDTR